MQTILISILCCLIGMLIWRVYHSEFLCVTALNNVETALSDLRYDLNNALIPSAEPVDGADGVDDLSTQD